jgi:hypothetical protein
VISFPSSAATTATVASTITALPASGVCAGRFPGGL